MYHIIPTSHVCKLLCTAIPTSLINFIHLSTPLATVLFFIALGASWITVLNLIQRMKKISILKNARFSGKGHQSLHI